MTASVSYTLKDKGFNEIQRQFKGLEKIIALVGLPGDSPQAVGADGKPVSGGLTVAGLGIIHEYGSPANGIPSRPFMRQTWTTYTHATKSAMKRLAYMVASGKLKAISAVAQLGLFYEGRIKTTIRNGSFAPNAPATIARKGSSKPLIDTGLLRASVTSRVVGK